MDNWTCFCMFECNQFLNTQRIDNLTAYLEALHKAQMASEDHTTLLLNCYTKRKDVSKLDEFIKVSVNVRWLLVA